MWREFGAISRKELRERIEWKWRMIPEITPCAFGPTFENDDHMLGCYYAYRRNVFDVLECVVSDLKLSLHEGRARK